MAEEGAAIPWEQWASPAWRRVQLVRRAALDEEAARPGVPPLHEVWEFEGDPVALVHKWAALAVGCLRPDDESAYEIAESCAEHLLKVHTAGGIAHRSFQMITHRGCAVSAAYAPRPGVIESVFANRAERGWKQAVRCAAAGALASHGGSGWSGPARVLLCSSDVADALAGDNFAPAGPAGVA